MAPILGSAFKSCFVARAIAALPGLPLETAGGGWRRLPCSLHANSTDTCLPTRACAAFAQARNRAKICYCKSAIAFCKNTINRYIQTI